MKSLIILLVMLYLLHKLYTRDSMELTILSLLYTAICTVILVYGGLFLALINLAN